MYKNILNKLINCNVFSGYSDADDKKRNIFSFAMHLFIYSFIQNAAAPFKIHLIHKYISKIPFFSYFIQKFIKNALIRNNIISKRHFTSS